MSREMCRNCSFPIDGKIRVVDVDGEAQPWCFTCAADKGERDAEVARERALGVYKGGGMGEPREEVFQSDKDGLWYWRKFGGNGEEDDRSTEGYSTEEHANEGLDRVREQDAERQAEIDADKARDGEPTDAGDAVDGQQQSGAGY